MFTTNSLCQIICPIHEWLLCFKFFKSFIKNVKFLGSGQKYLKPQMKSPESILLIVVSVLGSMLYMRERGTESYCDKLMFTCAKCNNSEISDAIGVYKNTFSFNNITNTIMLKDKMEI